MEDGILINCPSVKTNHRGSKLCKIRRRHSRRHKYDPQEPRRTIGYASPNGIGNRTAKGPLRIRQKRKSRKIQNVTPDALIGFPVAPRPELERRLQAIRVEDAHRQQRLQ